MSDDTTKICSKCGQSLPATLEYFHANKRKRDGLRSRCKVCEREYYQANKEAITEQRQADKDKRLKYDREYYQANKEIITKQRREYYQINKDKKLKRQHEWHQANKDKMAEKNREYRQANKEAVVEKKREWYQANPEKVRVYTINRRARKRSLPDTFTVGQWRDCLEYFSNACAVCGIEFGDSTPHADHWIPLNNPECTGTVVTNMVCLCSSCNLNKQDKLPDTWLIKRYGASQANEIMARIAAYFQSIGT